jgi:hypothetical protein
MLTDERQWAQEEFFHSELAEGVSRSVKCAQLDESQQAKKSSQ